MIWSILTMAGLVLLALLLNSYVGLSKMFASTAAAVGGSGA
jgi:hypothetical protein